MGERPVWGSGATERHSSGEGSTAKLNFSSPGPVHLLEQRCRELRDVVAPGDAGKSAYLGQFSQRLLPLLRLCASLWKVQVP